MQKRLSTKKGQKNRVFDFYYCVQIVSYYNFFGEIFALFSTDFFTDFAFYDTHKELFKHLLFAYISTFC
jgi:hypothetical protein